MLPLEDSRLLKPAKSSALAPSPLQTKPSSAPRVHSSSTPSSAYQAYRQGERDSYSASKPKPAAHPYLPSGHISSSPRPAVKKESEWSPADEKLAIRRAQNTITPAKPAKPLVTKEDDARETRRFHNQIAAAPKPSSPPRVAPANFIGPIAPGVRRAAPSNPAPSTRPKPAFGTAGDLAAATKASRDASKALADFRKDHTLSNKGGLRQESEMALRQAENVANKRYAAAKAEKAAQDAPAAIPTSLNRGGVRQEAINDARREASSARTTYLNSQGLDSSGKPVVVSPPKPPVPDKPKEKNLWDEVTGFVKANPMEVVHGALDVAGFIPGAGAVFDGANAVLYLAEGDKTNAALSAVAAIPGVGDAVAATAIAGKVAAKGAKAIEVSAKAVDKANDAVRWGRSALKVEKSAPSTSKTYITYTFRDGENVRYVGRASGKGTPEEVLAQRISKGHRIAKNHPKLTAQVEGLPGAIGVQGSRSANKGAEDVLYSYHQTRGDKIVNGQTVTGGASRGNQPLLNRTNPLSNIKRKIEATGRRHIENYARDLKGATPI
jgi:hypothetical protein